MRLFGAFSPRYWSEIDTLAEADRWLNKADQYEASGHIRRAIFYCHLGIRELEKKDFEILDESDVLPVFEKLLQKRQRLMRAYKRSAKSSLRTRYSESAEDLE